MAVAVHTRPSVTHPITVPQPVAEPPAAESCGSDHQNNVQDGEEHNDVACSNAITQNLINQHTHVSKVVYNQAGVLCQTSGCLAVLVVNSPGDEAFSGGLLADELINLDNSLRKKCVFHRVRAKWE